MTSVCQADHKDQAPQRPPPPPPTPLSQRTVRRAQRIGIDFRQPRRGHRSHPLLMHDPPRPTRAAAAGVGDGRRAGGGGGSSYGGGGGTTRTNAHRRGGAPRQHRPTAGSDPHGHRGRAVGRARGGGGGHRVRGGRRAEGRRKARAPAADWLRGTVEGGRCSAGGCCGSSCTDGRGVVDVAARRGVSTDPAASPRNRRSRDAPGRRHRRAVQVGGGGDGAAMLMLPRAPPLRRGLVAQRESGRPANTLSLRSVPSITALQARYRHPLQYVRAFHTVPTQRERATGRVTR